MMEERISKIVSQQPALKNVRLEDILVHSQMRKTFEQDLLGVLTDNIFIVGLINPIILNKKRENKRLILVAGERRLRAYKMLYDKYGRNFSRIPANIYNNLTEEQHNSLQYAENSYVPVNPAEAAEAYAEMYEKMKHRYDSLKKAFSKTFFAKIVGKGVSLISDALKFADLEADIRAWAKAKLLNYGSAVQITKIKNAKTRKSIAEIAMYKGYNEEKIKETVDKIISEESSGQINFFGDFKLESEEAQKKTVIEYLGKEIHMSGINAAQYMMKVLKIAEGKPKPNYNPLRLRSVREMIKNISLASIEMLKHSEELKHKGKEIEDNYKGPIIRIEYPSN